jgi:6-phosphogluconolactonase
MTIDVRGSADLDQAAAAAALLIEERARAAVAARDRFTLAVSGGGTPTRLFATLAGRPLPWASIHLFQVDERIAPLGDPDRNLGALAANLLDVVPIPWGNVHLMPVDAEDPAAAADELGTTLERVAAGSVLELVHLGVGDDGHTASWPPGDPDVGAWRGDVAVTGTFNGRRRMTLTPPAVNRARQVLWLVSGAAKAPVVAKLLDHDRSIPAGLVTVEDQVLFADAAALAPGG